METYDLYTSLAASYLFQLILRSWAEGLLNVPDEDTASLYGKIPSHYAQQIADNLKENEQSAPKFLLDKGLD